ncbi:sterol regulatory element-binding protein cleavage-activating protein [Holotrichia oblita]|uniref:Sterol regulatory element-binding protein cleavage-activating protein n=1 Tax=Holotrichia oblita TaxID=644536 RepID=A0ACB9TDL0_HOLOL|nr:sterol regulatory element-binding protein cleavage-activating protein [Holotrichia oblita]
MEKEFSFKSTLTGVSRATVYRVIKAYTASGKCVDPKKITGRPSLLKFFDETSRTAIRQIVHNMFRQNEPPTLDKVLVQVKNNEDLPNMSRSTLYLLMKQMNFNYPLIHLPIPGSLPIAQWVSTPNYTSTNQFIEEPYCYVQQVVLRTAVVPWSQDLNLGDAFRAPIYESFKLLDTVRNYQEEQSQKSLGHLCLHVESIRKVKDAKFNVLPEYACLVLSPANFWQQDVHVFLQDTNIIGTVFNHQDLQKGKTSIADMLFGMHLADTGIKRYPLRNRMRILQYAITLFFKEYDEQFIIGLKNKLQVLYPLHQNLNSTSSAKFNDTFTIQYPSDINFYKFVPLMLAFCVLFFYYYFSVRKIEIIKSKMGMAFTVVVTVFTSLTMTLGYCFFFGLILTIQGKEIFPFLVMLVGLENVLVLTKSVVTTSSHLDIKIRVAQGLSKEGWSITKNLMLEITILTIGIITCVPVIQEFCIFAVVALVADFFLQIFFFCTILGIDTRRCETSDNVHFRSSLYQQGFDKSLNVPIAGMVRSKSHPRLNTVHTTVVAGQAQHAQEKKIPKRLRVLNIWARTRFFQRSFMILMIAWISMILYKSGFINQYFLGVPEQNLEQSLPNRSGHFGILPIIKPNDSLKIQISQQKPSYTFLQSHTEDLNKLLHSEYPPWLKLSTYHWPSIFKKYNMSLAGKHIAILPNIKISYAISPEEAVLLRNPDEKFSSKFQWNSLAAALDPIDFSDLDSGSNLNNLPQSERPLYPTSPMEILLFAILCFISVIVLTYMVVVLYKCICSRNYAEWRASWTKERSEVTEIPVLLEAMPIVLTGHLQEVECLATDGTSIVSSCLGGQLKVWDSITGELQSSIDRSSIFTKQEVFSEDCDDNIMSDYESGSPPSREGSLLQIPSFKDRISLNFSNSSLRNSDFKRSEVFDFGIHYRQVFSEFEKKSSVRYKNSEWPRHHSDKSDYDKIYWRRDETTNESMEDLDDSMFNGNEKELPKLSPIWCMDYLDNLIVLGCADGRLEFWEGTTGKFKVLNIYIDIVDICEYYIYDDVSGVGVTSVKIVGSRVVAARLYGSIDILQLQSFTHGRPIDWNFSIAYRRTHIRTGSAGSIDCKHFMQNDSKEDMRCFKVLTAKAHQQPINCLDCEGGRIVSGSQDHTLKVFRLEDGTPLYTLHGHCGPITCLFIDRVCPGTSGSGSQDGMLCIWDLLTGIEIILPKHFKFYYKFLYKVCQGN